MTEQVSDHNHNSLYFVYDKRSTNLYLKVKIAIAGKRFQALVWQDVTDRIPSAARFGKMHFNASEIRKDPYVDSTCKAARSG